MKRLLLISVFLLSACGGGIGNNDIYLSGITGGDIQQDVWCCAQLDDNGNCVEYTYPKAVSFTFKVTYMPSEFSVYEPRIFRFSSYSVKLQPASSIFQYFDQDTLKELAGFIQVTAPDLTEGEEKEGTVALTQTLVERMKNYYDLYGTLLFTLEVNLVYVGEGGKSITIPFQVPLEFSDFLFQENDLCYTGE